MNLTRALNAALPEIQARKLATRCPRMPPDAVFQEHIEDGKPVVRVLVPSQDSMYRFPPENWKLVQLFDGTRTFEQIAELHSAQSGAAYDADEVREFAASLEEMDFWYKTPQEKNILWMQQSAEERQRVLKSKKKKYGDLSEIAFPAVNPDKFLTWLHKYTSFMYTWWFTLLTLALFGVMTGITLAHWSEIGRDSLHFFNFAAKTWGDVGVFYVLAVLTMCWHEIGHGHACKHFGGRVPAMGFLLIYLTPAFYTDTSEGVIKGTKFQNFIISLAGVWSELLICAVATIVWWGTPPNTTTHELAYFLMLMTGFASVLINWNPLMKLDGYYMVTEMWGLVDLKENSTAYVAAWVKRYIWRLPVEVPYVPRRRRLGYAAYGLLSGLYSYTVLYVLARFAGNVFRNFNPDWSFIPEIATAALIFRSRIVKLVNFMKFVYLDKKDRIMTWMKSRSSAGFAIAAVIILILPVWRESALGRFVLESARQAVIRSKVSGMITAVHAEEGMVVAVGAPLLELRNTPLESEYRQATADYQVATVHAASAAMKYGDLGTAIQQREELGRKEHNLAAQEGELVITSPIAGVVLTPRPTDKQGEYAIAGEDLMELGDLSRMKARIYMPEHDLEKVTLGAQAHAQVDGSAQIWKAQVAEVARVSGEMDRALLESSSYKGLALPTVYFVDLYFPNPEQILRPGMRGTARIYGQRRSIAGFAWREIKQFLGRKMW
jgi:putative peptide zinc metalloprotease protein